MEGVLQLRDVAEAIRVSRREVVRTLVGTSLHGKNGTANDKPRRQRFGNELLRFCVAGFARGARDDVLLVCEEYGIIHQERAGGATHVVLPFSREDMGLLGDKAVLERFVPVDAKRAGTPVVTIDFLLDLVDAMKKFDEVLGRQTKAYAVAGAGDEEGVEEVADSEAVLALGWFGEEGAGGETDVSERCRVGSLKIFGNQVYGTGSLAHGDSSFTQVQVVEGLGTGDGGEARLAVADNFNNESEENVDVNLQTPCTMPGTDAARELDLKNFAAISTVTPLEMGQDFYDVEDDFGTDAHGIDDIEDSEENVEDLDGLDDDEMMHAGLRMLTLQDDQPAATTSAMSKTSKTSGIDPQDIIPGDLLLRAPRNNKVRQRHPVPVGRQTIMYTDSITMRPKDRDIVDIDVKSSKNVAMQCGELIIKPLFFYKILGEGWRVEYRRFYRVRDLPVGELGPPTDLSPAELFLSTAIEGSSLHSMADVEKVFVDKLPVARRRPVLEMETAGSGAPAWFYRHEYDVETGKIVYKV